LLLVRGKQLLLVRGKQLLLVRGKQLLLVRGKQLLLVRGKQLLLVRGKQLLLVRGKQLLLVRGKQLLLVRGKQLLLVRGKQLRLVRKLYFLVEGKSTGIWLRTYHYKTNFVNCFFLWSVTITGVAIPVLSLAFIKNKFHIRKVQLPISIRLTIVKCAIQ